jgi:hypothetical protein
VRVRWEWWSLLLPLLLLPVASVRPGRAFPLWWSLLLPLLLQPVASVRPERAFPLW